MRCVTCSRLLTHANTLVTICAHVGVPAQLFLALDTHVAASHASACHFLLLVFPLAARRPRRSAAQERSSGEMITTLIVIIVQKKECLWLWIQGDHSRFPQLLRRM